MKWRVPFIGALLGASLGLLGAAAQADVDFSGKRIELIVPVAAGGASDLSARFLVPLIVERLPGKPTLVIRNVAGAGGIAGSNEFQDRAKTDGTDLIWQNPSSMLNYVFRDKRAHYRLDQWIPVLTTAQGTVVYANKSLGVANAQELVQLKDKEVVVGANNPTGGDLRVLLPLDLLGVKVKPIFGLNRSDVYPGFQRGEFTLNFDSFAAYDEQVKPMVAEGTAVPMFTLGYVDDQGKMVRDPSLPELPSFPEVYEQANGHPLEGEALAAWKSVFNLNVMTTRSVLLPAGTPQDVVDAYQHAVEQLAADIEKDPELKRQSAKFMGTTPMATGAVAARTLKDAVSFDDATFQWLNDWLKKKYDVSL